MGYQLAGKGKEYRRRCIARNRVQAGDNVFRPESFPSHQKDEKDAVIIPELPEEDLEEVCPQHALSVGPVAHVRYEDPFPPRVCLCQTVKVALTDLKSVIMQAREVRNSFKSE